MRSAHDLARFKQLGAQHPWLVEHLADMLKEQVKTLVRHHQVDVLHRAQGRAQQLEDLIHLLSTSSQ